MTLAAEYAELSERTSGPPYARARAFLECLAKRRIVITYQELTSALQILPPLSINQVTEALEHLTSARTHRAFRASAMQTWREVVVAA